MSRQDSIIVGALFGIGISLIGSLTTHLILRARCVVLHSPDDESETILLTYLGSSIVGGIMGATIAKIITKQN